MVFYLLKHTRAIDIILTYAYWFKRTRLHATCMLHYTYTFSLPLRNFILKDELITALWNKKRLSLWMLGINCWPECPLTSTKCNISKRSKSLQRQIFLHKYNLGHSFSNWSETFGWHLFTMNIPRTWKCTTPEALLTWKQTWWKQFWLN